MDQEFPRRRKNGGGGPRALGMATLGRSDSTPAMPEVKVPKWEEGLPEALLSLERTGRHKRTEHRVFIGLRWGEDLWPAQLEATTWLIQLLNLLTRVYMAGWRTLQLLVPQETTPISTHVFPFWQTRGPPESP